MNALPLARLLSIPNVVLTSSDMIIPNHGYNEGWRMKHTSGTQFTVVCNVTTDVRGNLGPALVLIQNQTTDWIKDRWQAASDMHGTNIRGQHYVRLDWSYDLKNPNRNMNDATLKAHVLRANKMTASHSIRYNGAQEVVVKRIVLDWEAAYSDNYDIQIWNETTEQWVSIFTMRPSRTNVKKQHPQGDKTTTPLSSFDITGGVVHATEWGQSPGVTFPTPLHIIHDITLDDHHIAPSTEIHSKSAASSKMQLLIHTSATGWGVSLWQIQVYGNYVLPTI
jgi:hypothetical protein